MSKDPTASLAELCRLNGYKRARSLSMGPAGGSRGRPCLRWKDEVEKDLESIFVSNWRRLEQEISDRR